MPNFETVGVTSDVLILGGGMAACGAAVEAAFWAKKAGLKVALVDKAPDRDASSPCAPLKISRFRFVLTRLIMAS